MNTIKKIIAIALVIATLAGTHALPVGAQKTEDGIELYAIALADKRYSFGIESDGTAKCYAYAKVAGDYTLKMTMQLQQNVGMWKNVETWQGDGSIRVSLDEKYQVEKGYSYRLMVVYVVYDSEGKKAESFYDLSDIVAYK